MGWGAPLGFSSGPTPFERISTASFGEPGWYCRFHPTPTAGSPLRASLRTPCAYATFHSPENAREFLDHPGDIPELARRYLAWVTDGTDPSRPAPTPEVEP